MNIARNAGDMGGNGAKKQPIAGGKIKLASRRKKS